MEGRRKRLREEEVGGDKVGGEDVEGRRCWRGGWRGEGLEEGMLEGRKLRGGDV